MFSPPPPAPVQLARKVIAAAERVARFERLRGRTAPVALAALRGQFRAVIDQVMGEAGLYAPEHAALALTQAEGDTHEAVAILRAFRSTLPRRYTSAVVDTSAMFVERRISSAFREIPGGQILGPTRDYSQRLLDAALATETAATAAAAAAAFEAGLERNALKPLRTFGKVTSLLRPAPPGSSPSPARKPAPSWPSPIPACAARAATIPPSARCGSAASRSV